MSVVVLRTDLVSMMHNEAVVLGQLCGLDVSVTGIRLSCCEDSTRTYWGWLVDGRLQWRFFVDVGVHLGNQAWLNTWCSTYVEESVTNWDLSTGQ